MFGRKPKPQRTYGRLLLSFTAGALAGGTAALLLTPMTGRKMQRKIGELKNEVVEAVGETVHEVQGKVRKMANT